MVHMGAFIGGHPSSMTTSASIRTLWQNLNFLFKWKLVSLTPLMSGSAHLFCSSFPPFTLRSFLFLSPWAISLGLCVVLIHLSALPLVFLLTRLNSLSEQKKRPLFSFLLPEQPVPGSETVQRGSFLVLDPHDQNHRFSIVLSQGSITFNYTTFPLWGMLQTDRNRLNHASSRLFNSAFWERRIIQFSI